MLAFRSMPEPRVRALQAERSRAGLLGRGLAVTALAAAVLLGSTTPSRAVDLPANLRVETVVASANFPVAMAWTPDGRLLYTEKSGAIRVVENGQLRDEPFAVFDVDDFFER